MTLPKSVANCLGSVFVPNVFFPVFSIRLIHVSFLSVFDTCIWGDVLTLHIVNTDTSVLWLGVEQLLTHSLCRHNGLLGKRMISFLRKGRDFGLKPCMAVCCFHKQSTIHVCSESAHIWHAFFCSSIGSQRLCIGSSKKQSRWSTKQNNPCKQTSKSEKHLGRPGHSQLNIRMVCLGSLLSSIGLCRPANGKLSPRSIHKGMDPTADSSPVPRIPIFISRLRTGTFWRFTFGRTGKITRKDFSHQEL